MQSVAQVLRQGVLFDVADRLRDRKPNVRKESCSQLLSLYRYSQFQYRIVVVKLLQVVRKQSPTMMCMHA